MKIVFTTVVLACISWVSVLAQAGVVLNTPDASPGYALLSLRDRAVLVDNCGEIVHEWDNIGSSDNHYKLLPNGNLVFISNGEVNELTWDGDIVNQFGLLGVTLTYEVELLPNGNYLCVGRRTITTPQAMAMGFDLSVQDPSRLDVVVEIDRNTGRKVWEWNIGDHIIQERDANVGNFGSVSENPQLLNIDALGTVDWTSFESFMINSMDYNAELDQIVLSIRKMSEFVIIDHSTPDSLVSGSTGGRQGKGGDILYRWGNPQNYGQGTSQDRQLYYQHNPNWIKEGPYKGHIGVFNNGLSRPVANAEARYSSADFVDTRVNPDGSYTMGPNNRFEPAEADLSYNRHTSLDFNFYSSYLSGATMLENGNIWITVGSFCMVMELTPEGEMVWRYSYNTNVFCFRTVKYPIDYPAFDGKTLEPMGTLETMPNGYECNLISAVNDPKFSESFDFNYDMTEQRIQLKNVQEELMGQLIDINGRLLQSDKIKTGRSSVQLKSIPSGIYFYNITSSNNHKSTTYKLFIP